MTDGPDNGRAADRLNLARGECYCGPVAVF
jgi:hypothetical protein